MSDVGNWGYSSDGEIYFGNFATADEAIADGGDPAFVGQYIEPTDPSTYLDADLLIDHAACQDEYCGEYAEGWPCATKEQEDDLTAEVQRVFGEWMDRHDLRPWWKIVDPKTVIERRKV